MEATDNENSKINPKLNFWWRLFIRIEASIQQWMHFRQDRAICLPSSAVIPIIIHIIIHQVLQHKSHFNS